VFARGSAFFAGLPAAATSTPAAPPTATTLATFGFALACSFPRWAGWFLRLVRGFVHSRRSLRARSRLRRRWRLAPSYRFHLANLLRLWIEPQLRCQFFPMIVFAHFS
jgi:hypothetical protein